MLQNIFGGELPWYPQDWTSSDDTVRGGASFSSLKCSQSSPIAIFRGFLDVKKLGGAGFASQRTATEDRVWDLSNYDGILLDVTQSDGKKYTFSLKDYLAAPWQSTVSWDYDFVAAKDGQQIKILWSDFKPTYRGREHKDTPPLNLRGIKRYSLMMRSFFGSQEGEFSLSLASISSFKAEYGPYHDKFCDDSESSSTDMLTEKSYQDVLPSSRTCTWFGRIFGDCIGRK